MKTRIPLEGREIEILKKYFPRIEGMTEDEYREEIGELVEIFKGGREFIRKVERGEV